MIITKIIHPEFVDPGLIISDGKHELLCMKDFFEFDGEPQIGMEVFCIEAQVLFMAVSESVVFLHNTTAEHFIQKGESHYEYTLQGVIENEDIPILKVFGFSISLECVDIPTECGRRPKKGEFLRITVDRLDCCYSKD